MTAKPAYATTAQLKARMGITDDDRDELLDSALAAASRYIDGHCGRRFWLDEEATARTINPLGRVVRDEDGERLLVPDIGDLDGLTVEVGRAPSWTDVTSAVEAQPTDALDDDEPVTSLLKVGGYWSTGGGLRVRVTARWGWPQIPGPVAEATLLQANRLFKRKDSPEGVAGSAEWGVIRLSRIDPDVQALVQRLVLPAFG